MLGIPPFRVFIVGQQLHSQLKTPQIFSGRVLLLDSVNPCMIRQWAHRGILF